MKNRLPRKIKKQIPKNTMFCYEYTGKSGMYFNENYQTKLPYWKIKRCELSFMNQFGYRDCRYSVKTFGKFNGENPDEFPDLALNDNCKSCGFSEENYK